MGEPYRNDHEALTERLAALEGELARVRSRIGELEGLNRREPEIVGAIADVRKRLDGLGKKRSLPLLERVRVASPCTASWDAMTGDDQVRFCSSCEKNVYNLSAMTADEAQAFVQARGETACIRFHRRADGTMLTQDCPVGVRRKRVRRVVAAAVGGGLVAAAAFAFGDGGGVAPVTMGKIAIEPTSAPPEPVMGAIAVQPDEDVPAQTPSATPTTTSRPHHGHRRPRHPR